MLVKNCKICGLQNNCIVCGFRVKAKKKESHDEQIAREHDEYLMHVWGRMRKAQARTTGNADLDKEIRLACGPWLDPPRALYVSPIKDLYDEAFLAEHRGDRNQARSLYKKLHLLMKDDDRIHYKITKADIEERIKRLSK